MTHRDQIERAIKEWGSRDRAELPKYLRNPQNEHDFALAMAVGLHDQYPEVTPIYDESTQATGHDGAVRRGVPQPQRPRPSRLQTLASMSEKTDS